MNQVISIGGQMASGKDTLADFLPAEFYYKWHRAAFANAVKKVFIESFDVDYDFIEKWKRIDEAPPGFLKPVRKSLQFIGDGFREIRGDIWIELAFRNLDGPTIISDCRYINEAKYTKSYGGITVAIWRPGWENDDPNPSEAQIKPIIDFLSRTHKDGPINLRENGIVPSYPDGTQYFDFFLINDGTVEDLHNKARSIFVPYVKERFNVE